MGDPEQTPMKSKKAGNINILSIIRILRLFGLRKCSYSVAQAASFSLTALEFKEFVS